MTHPQDPEQQEAVHAFMQNLGFYYGEDPEDCTTGEYSIVTSTEQVTPLQKRNNYLIFTPEQATFFYRTHQAQVAEALDELVSGAKQRAGEAYEYQYSVKVIPIATLERAAAQLTPQKPKQEKQP